MRIKEALVISFMLCYFAQAGQSAQKILTLNVGLRPRQIVFTPDNKFLLCIGSSWDNGDKLKKSVLQWWDVQGKALRKTVAFREHSISSIAITSDGKTLATAHSDEVRLWDARTGHAKLTLRTPATLVAFSPDGKTFATAGEPVTRQHGRVTPNKIIVRLWNVQDLKLEQVLTKGDLTNGFQDEESSFFVTSIDFAPDGNTIAAATALEIVVLWGTQTGKVENTLMRPGFEVIFSPDGKTVAVHFNEVITSESTSPTYSLWDVETWKPKAGFISRIQKQRIENREVDPAWAIAAANAIAFSPDSKTVAVGFGDTFVGLYDGQTGKLTETVTENQGHYSAALAFSPDGQLLASGSWTTIEMWRIKK